MPKGKRSVLTVLGRIGVGALLCGYALLTSAQTSTPPSREDALRSIQTQLPPAPDGFEWRLFKNALFLKPSGWFEHDEVAKGNALKFVTDAVSPKDFSPTKQFEMGFTVQIMSGIQKTRGIPAKKAVIGILAPVLKSHPKEDVLKFSQRTSGDFETTLLRYRDAPLGLKPIIVHQFLVANDTTDTVNIFIFESPADSFEDNWTRFGNQILSRVSVAPNLAPN